MLARYGGAFGTSVGLHAALAVWFGWTIVMPATAVRQADRPVEVVLLPPAEDSRFPGLKPVEPDPARTPGDLKAEGEIAGADIDRIGGHFQVLFPFVNPGLAIDAFFPTIKSPSRLTFENPYKKAPADRTETKNRRLTLSTAALQAIVDESWTRARRWSAFASIRQMTVDGDAHDPALASLLALYRDQNALQPYADGAVRDLRLWAQLGLAADHVDFIGFIRGYAAAHPSTRATTELLFLLDTLAQANADALAVLVETDQPGDLDWTKETHPRAYLLARDIKRYYAPDIVRLGLTSRPAIEAFYERDRLAILTRVLETTPDGYRADEARFLIGEILWREGRSEAALRSWREMTDGPSEATYATVIAQLRAAVRAATPDKRNIRFILSNQQGRWAAFSDDRLRRFGYRVDMY